MTLIQSLSYKEYENSKENILKNIELKNANAIFMDGKEELFTQLKQLDINDIAQIQDFYLTVTKVTYSGSLMWALQKSKEKNITVDDARDQFNAKHMIAMLVDHFKEKIDPLDQHNFIKILKIDKQYQPTKEAWAYQHALLLEVGKKLCVNERVLNLTKIIHKKLNFIKEKAQKLRKKNHIKSATIAETMVKNIENITENFLIDGNKETFKNACDLEIKQARPLLKHYSELINILDLLILLIQFLSDISHRLKSNRYPSFFIYPLAKKIDQLEAIIADNDYNPSPIS